MGIISFRQAGSFFTD